MNDDETRQASALSIDEMLVDAARIGTYTLHEIFVICISVLASATDSVNGHVAGFTIAEESVDVEDLVDSASIAVGLVAVADLDGCRFAPTGGVTATVGLGRYADCQ